MEIETRGLSLRIAVNGRDVLDVMLNKTRPARFPVPGLKRYSGRIGIMKAVGEVRFRKIEIKERSLGGREEYAGKIACGQGIQNDHQFAWHEAHLDPAR